MFKMILNLQNSLRYALKLFHFYVGLLYDILLMPDETRERLCIKWLIEDWIKWDF